VARIVVGRADSEVEWYLIPSQAPVPRVCYHYDDFDIENGVTYYYWLEDVDLDGTIWHGRCNYDGTNRSHAHFAGSQQPGSGNVGAAWAVMLGGALMARRRK
jgi:MYXO-CTERM domain-containing protein